MNCDLCNKPAAVHEVTVKDGFKNEVHLCEEHAAQAGIDLPGHQSIDQLLTQFVVCKGGPSSTAKSKPTDAGKTARVARRTCRTCGLTFRAFRQSGLLGCSDCYQAFEQQIAPMIERAQNGATSHAGKCPRRGGASIDRQLRVQRLSRELEDAVSAEQYERAAELRDRLRAVDPEATLPD